MFNKFIASYQKLHLEIVTNFQNKGDIYKMFIPDKLHAYTLTILPQEHVIIFF